VRRLTGQETKRKLRRLSPSGQNRLIRAQALRRCEDALYLTTWGKHFARPAQVRAGARKMLDIATAQNRKAQKSEVR
jgi:hypothetical protein